MPCIVLAGRVVVCDDVETDATSGLADETAHERCARAWDVLTACARHTDPNPSDEWLSGLHLSSLRRMLIRRGCDFDAVTTEEIRGPPCIELR